MPLKGRPNPAKVLAGLTPPAQVRGLNEFEISKKMWRAEDEVATAPSYRTLLACPFFMYQLL